MVGGKWGGKIKGFKSWGFGNDWMKGKGRKILEVRVFD